MPILKVRLEEKYPRPYWPKELIAKGYTGEIEAIPNACVVVIPKPNANHEDIAESLEYMAADFRHKARLVKKEEATLEIKSQKALKINGRKYDVYLNLETKRFRMEPIKKVAEK